jgi:hypothetical protein
MEEYRIGDINSSRLRRDEYLAPPAREPCSSCWALPICAGGCYYDNLALTGDRFRPDPAFCADLREVIETAIVIYCDLSDAERAWLLEETERIRGRPAPAPGAFFSLFQEELGGLLSRPPRETGRVFP